MTDSFWTVFRSEGLVGSRWDRSGIEVGSQWDCGGIIYSGAKARQLLIQVYIDGHGGIQAHKDVLRGIYNGFSPKRVCLDAIDRLQMEWLRLWSVAD